MKRALKSRKLLFVFTLLLIISFAGTVNTSALVARPVTLPQDEFLFIDTHIHTEGIGEVNGGMMIDFPTYGYSPEDKTLTTLTKIPNYSLDTKVIIGSGRSLSGTAGGGAATGLTAYDTFDNDTFSINSNYSVSYYMNGAARNVPVGGSWTETVETKPSVGDGKLITTYTINNYGVLKKSSFNQEILIPSMTATLAPTPTPTVKPKKFKISGYIRPEPKLNFKSYCQGFKISIYELNTAFTTDPSGHYVIEGIPESLEGYTLLVSKKGYPTRTISINTVSKDMEIGSLDSPVSMYPGDIDNNNAINMSDVVKAANSFNLTSSSPNFNKDADLNYDNVVNMKDIIIISANFNKTSYSYEVPFMANQNHITMKKDETTSIALAEGGIIGLMWNYSISDQSIIRFERKIPGIYPYPDAFAQSKWIFRAIGAGEANILFTSSMERIAENYIVTVTDDTSPTAAPTVTTAPTATPDKEPELVSSTELKSTLISTDPDEKVVSGKNIVYCPTFQMAWDEFKNVIGGDILLSGKPALADRLNSGFPVKDSISPDSYLSMAGYGQKTVDRINAALKEKFKDSAPQVKENIAPSDIIAYSYLGKNLCFLNAFENIKMPIRFTSGTNEYSVNAFGINSNSKKYNDLSKQVWIYDYKSDNDFIVKLSTKDDLDEIILAKVAPDKSLYKTYNSVMERINASRPQNFNPEDSLVIPKLDFNIDHNYTEFEGKDLLNPGFEGYTILKAYQRTRFRLDENGAKLASEATIIAYTSIHEPKALVFDGPYMVILKEKDAANPYLMLWVDNPELMSK